MKFLHNDLGHLEHGATVVITLQGNQANVRLMDSVNFSAYKGGRACHFYGGLAKSSPIRLDVPHAGHWHIAVDMKGLEGEGEVRAGIRVIS